MRRLTLIFLAVIIVISFNLAAFAVAGDVETGFIPNTTKKLSAEAIYLKNLDTGDVIYTKNIDEKIYPASLTKLMTVIIAMENTDDLNTEMVEYPPAVQDYLYSYSLEHGALSTGGLVAGEIRSMKEFVYASMLPSANEAAMSIAIHVGGDIDSFLELMNNKAKELGMENTKFANVTGLYDDNNYTTVRDLAILTEHAFTVDGLMDIASTYKYTAGKSNLQESLTWVSTVELQNPDLKKGDRYYYEGIRGVKTGTIPESGHNFISTIEKDGFRYMLIVVGCTPIGELAAFMDTKQIYDWVFSSLRNQTLVGEKEVVGEIPVMFGKDTDFVQLETSSHFTILIPDTVILVGDGAQIEKKLNIPENIEAPIKKGQHIGDYVIELMGEEVGRVELVAKTAVPYSASKKLVNNITNAGIGFWFKLVLAVVVAIVIIYIILLIIRRYNKNKKYRAFKEKTKYNKQKRR